MRAVHCMTAARARRRGAARRAAPASLSLALALAVGVPSASVALAAPAAPANPGAPANLVAPAGTVPATGTATTGANPAPSPGITAPVGPGHRGGAQLDQTGVLLYDRPAGVPRPPDFSAGAYLVADLNSGDVLLAFNPHVQSLPASTMKTLTALALVPALDPAHVVQATPEDAAVDGTKVGIDPGASYTVDQLFHAMLMSSANDASLALARAAGGLPTTLARMNEIAARIGAVDTTAKNTNGLDAVGQVTTAYDLALIGREALANPAIARYVTTKTADFPSGRTKKGQARTKYQISNHNRLLWNYDGAVGVKNGYTIKARQTFIGAARRGRQAYIVTYLAGEGGGWRATADLLDWAFDYGPKLRAVGTLNQPAPASGDPDSSGGAAAALSLDPTVATGAQDSTWSALARPAAIAGGVVALLAAAVVALRIRAVRRMRRRSVGAPRPRSHTTV